MSNNIKIEKVDGYLLVTLSDTVITKDRALEILGDIAEQSKLLKCNKVLLDERTVESREVTGGEIMKISIDMARQELHKIRIAFWCKSGLINGDSSMLGQLTYTDEHVVRHFIVRDEALAWLGIEIAN